MLQVHSLKAVDQLKKETCRTFFKTVNIYKQQDFWKKTVLKIPVLM
jgi:hypothetical protein